MMILGSLIGVIQSQCSVGFEGRQCQQERECITLPQPILRYDGRDPGSLLGGPDAVQVPHNLVVSSGTLVVASVDGIGGIGQNFDVILENNTFASKLTVLTEAPGDWTTYFWATVPPISPPDQAQFIKVHIGVMNIFIELVHVLVLGVPTLFERMTILYFNPCVPDTVTPIFENGPGIGLGAITHFTTGTRRLVSLTYTSSELIVSIDGVPVFTDGSPPDLTLSFGCSNDTKTKQIILTATGTTPPNDRFEWSNDALFNRVFTPAEIIDIYNRGHLFDFPAPLFCFERDCSNPRVCGSGSGTCIDNDVCQCNPGKTGDECCQVATITCPGLASQNYSSIDHDNVCSGNGRCTPTGCDCCPHFKLTEEGTCTIEQCNGVDYDSLSVCNGNGACQNEICICDTGLTGVDCQVGVCIINCDDPFTNQWRQLNGSNLTNTNPSNPDERPSYRSDYASVKCGGKFWIYGGSNEAISLDDLWIYDSTTNTFKKIIPLGTSPLHKSGHQFVCVNDLELWTFGGWDLGFGLTNTLQKYVIGTNTWSLVSPTGTLPVPSTQYALAVLHDLIYKFAGSGGPANSQLWSYDTSNGSSEWVLVLDNTNFPSPGHLVGAKATNLPNADVFYMFGGISSGGGNGVVQSGVTVSVNLETILDASGFQLDIVPAAENLINVFATSLWKFDLNTGNWSQAISFTNPPIERKNHGLVQINNALFAFAGDNAGGFAVLDSLWRYSLLNNRWDKLHGNDFVIDESPVYGIQGEYGPLNTPGGRGGVNLLSGDDDGITLLVFGGRADTGFIIFYDSEWQFRLGNCSFDQCKNGGFCAGPNICKCRPFDSWTGPTCTIAICSNCTGFHRQCLEPGNCTCEPGWNGPTCDNPICLPSDSLCSDPNSECISPGHCDCITGFQDFGTGICKEVCAFPRCDIHATCTGVETCTCNVGFSGNGTFCTPECTSPICNENQTCKAVNDIPTCKCKPNFVEINDECIKECTTCLENEQCLEGGVTCVCIDGFFKDSPEGICKPGCHPGCANNANCASPDNCTCNFGYAGLPEFCIAQCPTANCTLPTQVCVAPNQCGCNTELYCGLNCDTAICNGCVGPQPERIHHECFNVDMFTNDCRCEAGYAGFPTCVSSCTAPTCTVNEHCASPNNCECDTGFFKNGQNVCEESCPTGFFRNDQNVCEEGCPEGFFRNDQDECEEACPEGQFRNEQDECETPCPEGQFKNSSGLCEQCCPEGLFKNAQGQCENPCPEGQFKNATSGQCETPTCPPGEICCEDGFFRDEISQECVKSCDEGFTLNSENVCVICTSNVTDACNNACGENEFCKERPLKCDDVDDDDDECECEDEDENYCNCHDNDRREIKDQNNGDHDDDNDNDNDQDLPKCVCEPGFMRNFSTGFCVNASCDPTCGPHSVCHGDGINDENENHGHHSHGDGDGHFKDDGHNHDDDDPIHGHYHSPMCICDKGFGMSELNECVRKICFPQYGKYPKCRGLIKCRTGIYYLNADTPGVCGEYDPWSESNHSYGRCVRNNKCKCFSGYKWDKNRNTCVTKK